MKGPYLLLFLDVMLFPQLLFVIFEVLLKIKINFCWDEEVLMLSLIVDYKKGFVDKDLDCSDNVQRV